MQIRPFRTIHSSKVGKVIASTFRQVADQAGVVLAPDWAESGKFSVAAANGEWSVEVYLVTLSNEPRVRAKFLQIFGHSSAQVEESFVQLTLEDVRSGHLLTELLRFVPAARAPSD